MAENEGLLRIAQLLDDLKHDDIAVRVNSMRHLREIMDALGQQRTRDELLPFLGDTVMDDEDEVLLVAAEEFGGLVPQVGGVDHIPSLLAVLEELASVDEPMVRAKAVESINRLVAQMKKGAVTQHFIPIVRRLAAKDWFTARSAACALFTTGYEVVSADVKAELRGIFGNLCRDDTPTVRKAAAENIGNFAAIVSADARASEIIPLFQELSRDTQDSVRIHSMKNLIAFARLETDKNAQLETLKFVNTLVDDKAWRVKWTVANSYHDLAAIVVQIGEANALSRYIQLYVRLLVDREPEVRAAAVMRMKAVGESYKAAQSGAVLFGNTILPQLPSLVADQSDFVRTEMASVILGLAPVVGKEKTIEFLVPHYLETLRDKDSQVKLNLIGSLDSLDDVIPVDYISETLLLSVKDLAIDPQWRIRHSIIGHVPLIAKHLGQELFDKQLVEPCMNWLQDEVFSIREAATANLSQLVELFGEDWAREQVFGPIEQLSANSSYLFRMQSLRAIENLAPVLSSDALNTELLPFALNRLAVDATPNIRFNVAKCIQKICTKLTKGVLQNDVVPVLETLEKDADEDVKYFAAQCMEEVKRRLE